MDFCTTTLYKSLINNFKNVGIYGDSNPNYVKDWIKVSDAGCVSGKFMIIKIYYSRIGKDTNI